jgi:hypothetical protein
MSEIAHRVLREPAVFFGLITSIALAAITIISGDPWDLAAIAAVILPLAEALGIRSLVHPTEPKENP